jgi:VIT1/CCC1 family predicted Fe2+/Mn2+ transporter
MENHKASRIGWLRAAVLGANDGTISIASLVVGVAAAGTSHHNILITGVAGLIAGAMSMAAGEYVSVQSQADTEDSDLKTEKGEFETDPEQELMELASIYVSRGLDQRLARLVAEKQSSL